MPTQRRNANVQLMTCLTDAEDIDDSDYRLLVDGRLVKYLVTAPGAFRNQPNDRTFAPVLLGELIPELPGGDWNRGYIAWDSDTKNAVFTRTESALLPAVKNVWHTTKLHELDFEKDFRIKQNIFIARNPAINGGNQVLLKMAVWPWEIEYMEAETSAYQKIDGHHIGPKFLGHLTEGKTDRVIGIVIEYIADARHARWEDLGRCQTALARMHALGAKFDDINRYNFLVRGDRQDVVLVDFESVEFDCPPLELKKEMNSLSDDKAGYLRSTSKDGSCSDADYGGFMVPCRWSRSTCITSNEKCSR